MDSGRFIAGILLMAVGFGHGADLLNLTFNDSAHLGKQSGSLATAAVLNGAQASSQYPGSVDLGESGLLSAPFHSPQGPFSVEARFMLRDYAPIDTRFISDILNTATWDIGPNQGFAFRLGAGYFYGLLPDETPADTGWYDNTLRASVSKCIGDFTMAGKNNTWKEAVTDRCIERNTWVHMVGVWDGSDLHIYLNGQYATDTLRIAQKNALPNMNADVTAYIGGRADNAYDSRHFIGLLDFVRVVDSAMDARAIRENYRRTRGSDTLCRSVLIPAYPNPGQYVTGESPFRLNLVADGACLTPGFKPALEAGDSVEVAIATDPEFDGILMSAVIGQTMFQMDAKARAAAGKFKGGAFWRARIRRHGVAPENSDWSMSRSLVLDLSATPAAVTRAPSPGRRLVTLDGPEVFAPDRGSLKPALWSLSGRRLSVPWVRASDGWHARVSPAPGNRLAVLAWE